MGAWRFRIVLAVAPTLAMQFAAPALAQTAIAPVKIVETVKPREPVSGTAAMGLAVVPATARGSDITSMRLHFPEAYRGAVKIEISGVDGRYIGSADYVVNAPANSDVQLSFPTKQLPLLKEYGSSTLAIRATRPGDGGEPRHILLSYGAPSDMATVYVNSSNSDIYVFDAATKKLRRCPRVVGMPEVTFDTVCQVSAPAGTSRITLRRVRGAERLDPITIDL